MIRFNDKEGEAFDAIIKEEGIQNQNQFCVGRILQKRRMQPLVVSEEQKVFADVYNILNGTIDDYRNSRDIIEDLKEVSEKVKKFL